MTHLERLHLEAFRKKSKLDKAEIDNKLSYDENKTHLKKLARAQGHSDTIKQNDKEANEWAKEYIDYAKKADKEEKEKLKSDYGIEI